MQTIPLSDASEQIRFREARRQEDRWTSQIRVERRHGLTYYTITFSNGRGIVASLRGGFTPLPLTAAAVQAEAISAATDWLAHVKPATQIKKLHHIRNQTNPNNRHKREHRVGRRAA